MKGFDSNGNSTSKGKDKTYGQEQANRLKKRRDAMQSAQGDPFDWRTVNPDKLLHLCAIIAACGGAIRLGVTRDKGAMAVGYYLGGESWTEYVRPQEDMDAYLEAAIGDWLGTAEALGIDL